METTISLVKSKEHYQSIQRVLCQLKKDIKKALSKINRLVIKIILNRTESLPMILRSGCPSKKDILIAIGIGTSNTERPCLKGHILKILRQ